MVEWGKNYIQTCVDYVGVFILVYVFDISGR